MGISGKKRHVPGAEGWREDSPQQSTARHISKRKESVRHTLVQERSPCYPSQPKVETTRTSIDWQMDKQNVTDPHSGTSSHKNE